jgi:hypothetical protein
MAVDDWMEASIGAPHLSRMWGGYYKLDVMVSPQFRLGGSLPFWIVVPVFLTLAAAPWIRWRFSLRTLLIATTLIAALLGVFAYAARK